MALPQNVTAVAGSEEIVFDADEKTIENAKTSRSFDIPNDDYMVKVEKAEPGRSRKDKKMLKITYTIMGEKEPCAGLHVWDNLPLEDRGYPDMLLQRCFAMGYNVKNGQDNRIHIVPKDMVGLYLGVTVVNEEYNGKKSPKIKKVFNLNEPEPTAAPAKQ